MKIAMVSSYDLAARGGVQTHVCELSKALLRDGHQVTVLAPCTGNEPVYSMGGVDLVSFGGTVPFRASGSVARISMSIWQQPKLISILGDKKFDVVHIHEPLMPFFGLMVSYFSPSPTVGTFHAYSERRMPFYRFSKRLLNKGANRLNGRIAVSDPAAKFANRYFPGDYEVIPNGVNYKVFSTLSNRPSVYKKEYFNVFFIGRVAEERKGLKYLLAAYSNLKRDFPKIRLIVGGSGVPNPSTYRLMGERVIEDVMFLGSLSDEDLPGYYQYADLFCAPNTGQESFGMVCVEAMAAGTPIVASDIPGFRTVIENGKQGLLVPPKNENDLARAISYLIEHPERRTHMSVSGQMLARQYDWDIIADKVYHYYERVLEKQPVPPSLYKG